MTTTRKKKPSPMVPKVVRMPRALIRMVEQDARKSGKDFSTYVRDVLASAKEPTS